MLITEPIQGLYMAYTGDDLRFTVGLAGFTQQQWTIKWKRTWNMKWQLG